MPEKLYAGVRSRGIAAVQVNGVALDPRFDIADLSSTGTFDWGRREEYDTYGGQAQLALALLADHLDDDEMALEMMERFTWRFIATFPFSGWELRSCELDRMIRTLRELYGLLP